MNTLTEVTMSGDKDLREKVGKLASVYSLDLLYDGIPLSVATAVSEGITDAFKGRVCLKSIQEHPVKLPLAADYISLCEPDFIEQLDGIAWDRAVLVNDFEDMVPERSLLVTDRSLMVFDKVYVGALKKRQYFMHPISGRRENNRAIIQARADEPLEELIDTGAHEIGHILGIKHCHTATCEMFPVTLERYAHQFCRGCERKLDKKLGQPVAHPKGISTAFLVRNSFAIQRRVYE